MSSYVSHVSDIPQKECWVIVKDISIFTPGDQRSKEAPGHGYPEHTDNYAQVYEIFETEAEFKEALGQYVARAFSANKQPGIRGMKVIPYDTTLTVSVQATPAKR